MCPCRGHSPGATRGWAVGFALGPVLIRFFDASALVKRYVREEDSSRLARWLAAGTAATARLSAVEVASALARRCREGASSPAERDRALAALELVP